MNEVSSMGTQSLKSFNFNPADHSRTAKKYQMDCMASTIYGFAAEGSTLNPAFIIYIIYNNYKPTDIHITRFMVIFKKNIFLLCSKMPHLFDQIGNKLGNITTNDIFLIFNILHVYS